MKNILVLGGGAREEVIKEKLGKYNCIISSKSSFEEIKRVCLDNSIDFVIPSTEEYLCNGIVDFLLEHNIKSFGPTKRQAQIEGSKNFSKTIMKKLNIPTSEYKHFNTLKEALSYYKKTKYENTVIKYSGLDKGKGVYLPESQEKGLQFIHFKLNKGYNDGILIEDRLIGTEVSVMAFCNGKEAYLMPQSQDYKRIKDGDIGLNTGGMGAICPCNVLSEDELNEVKIYLDKVTQMLKYKGVLYAGIMKTEKGVKFLEFNCRFGDPEAQVILNLLDTDLLEIMNNCMEGKTLDISWKNQYAANVVLSHVLYPVSKSQKPLKINYGDLSDEVKLYPSNVTNEDFTTGGRVMSVVSVDNSLETALQNVYNNIYKITYDGAYYRRDIGSNNTKPAKKNNLSIGIMASGGGTSVELLLKERRKDVKVIFTNMFQASVIEKARAMNIPVICMPRVLKKRPYYEKITNILRQFNVKILILSGYMDIVTSTIYNEFHTINIHPSLLPKYKGMMDMDVHNSVIKNKDLYSGCTLHVVTKNVDGGRILKQKQTAVDTKNSYTLKLKIQELEKKCILEYIDEYSRNNDRIKYNVNIEEGNKFVEMLKETNPKIGGFCAEYEYKGLKLAAATDGCGTKIDLSNKFKKLKTIGIDLVAMNVNDLLVSGAKPLFFMDYIAIDRMNKTKCMEIVSGVSEGCRISNCELIGGETAEMKNTYMKNKLDLAGFCVGEKIHEFPLNTMNDSCLLYGIKSSGVHSNGYTLVRDLLEVNPTTPEFVDHLLKPTRIYMELLELYKKYPENILGAAHITGGGFHDNLVRIIPDSMYFKLNHWNFPMVFKWIQETSNMSRVQMLNTFNCGYGIVLISNIELFEEQLDCIGQIENK